MPAISRNPGEPTSENTAESHYRTPENTYAGCFVRHFFQPSRTQSGVIPSQAFSTQRVEQPTAVV